jgi:hypothetical protein
MATGLRRVATGTLRGGESVGSGTVCSHASTHRSVGASGRQRPEATRSEARNATFASEYRLEEVHDRLARCAIWHLREEALRAAVATVVTSVRGSLPRVCNF